MDAHSVSFSVLGDMVPVELKWPALGLVIKVDREDVLRPLGRPRVTVNCDHGADDPLVVIVDGGLKINRI